MDGSFFKLTKNGDRMVIIKKEKFTSEKSVLYVKNKQTEEKKVVSEGTDTDVLNNDINLEFGIAVDIGTTSIAIGIFDIKSGSLIGNQTRTNCQTMYGSDVMMRIMHCINGKERLLHDILIEQIEDMTGSILDNNISGHKSNIHSKISSKIVSKESDKIPDIVIKKMVVVGNTTMCHIFLNKDVTGLKGAPFSVAYEGVYRTNSYDIGFKIYDIDEVIVLPNIMAHVGADAAAVLCKEKMYKTGINEIAIDIGTNAEILLNCSGKVFVTSTAAGPAFEGKGIRSGMRAAPGAINSVKISRVNGNIILGMLDDGKAENPRGLCGSGLIDAISELMKARLLKKDGYLLTREEALRQNVNINLCKHLKSDDKDGNCFILSEENNIVITQKDIRNVQLAKGAIQAGCEILLKKAGIGLNDINSIKIAGVFGKYIHVSQAMNFGLFPKYPEKLEIVGNAAGDGAAMALFEDGFIDEMEKQVKKVHHVELAGEKDFQKKFMNAMELKEWYYN